MSDKIPISEAQRSAQLKALRRDDSSIVDVEVSCSHAALYVLERGASVHWRKMGIEGFFYLIKRDSAPQFRILLRNQTGSGEGDFVQSLDDAIRYEVKEDTFFYQVGNHGDVRGLWFHDKAFMPVFVEAIKRIYRLCGLPCDGAYMPDVDQRREPNTASGQAILQMLKKGESSPTRQMTSMLRTNGSESPEKNILNLLRQEFACPPIPPPPPPTTEDRSVVNLARSASFRANLTLDEPAGRHDRRADSEVFPMSKPQLRDALRAVLLSDAFLDDLVERILNRCTL